MLEGQSLRVDGTPSFDPDVGCGDSIVAYAWDVNGNGQFDDPGVDVAGATPDIPWAALATLMWPADPSLDVRFQRLLRENEKPAPDKLFLQIKTVPIGLAMAGSAALEQAA